MSLPVLETATGWRAVVVAAALSGLSGVAGNCGGSVETAADTGAAGAAPVCAEYCDLLAARLMRLMFG